MSMMTGKGNAVRGSVGSLLIVVLGLATLGSIFVYEDPSLLDLIPGAEAFVADAGAVPDDWKVYSSRELGIIIQYPPGYVAKATEVHTQLGRREGTSGVSFSVPKDIFAGTELVADSGFSIEVIPAVPSCVGSLFLDEDISSYTMRENGTPYSVAKSAGTGVGHRYEEIVFAIPGSNPCTAVRYSIHSKSAESENAAAIRAFDKKVLLKEFDMMRRSLVFDRREPLQTEKQKPKPMNGR